MAYLKVIAGPMFSGKTEELIRILRRSDLAGKKIVVVKPQLDSRTDDEIVSRRIKNGDPKDFEKSGTYPARPIASEQDLIDLVASERPAILGIDEAQFFEPWLVEFLSRLLRDTSDTDLTVLVAGLDMDAWGKPFGSMPEIMAMADEVRKETAICFKCKLPAMLTQKLNNSEKQVEVGDSEMYEARCRVCYKSPEDMPSA